MKDRVRQGDILRGVTPAALELAAGKLALTAQFYPPGRHQWLAQRFAKIQQLDPPSATEIPLGIREAVHFRLRIQTRAPGREFPLFEREAVAPDGELCREADGQWLVALRGELQVLPFEVAKVQRVVRRAPGIEREMQVAAFHGKRRFYVVVEDPAVLQRQPPDM